MLAILFYHVSSYFLDYWLMLFDFCNSIAEHVTGIPRKEAKSEIEIHPVTVEAKVRKCPV